LPGPSNIPIDSWDDSREKEASSPNARQEDRTNLTYAEYKVALAGETTAKVRTFLNETKQVYRNTDWSIDTLRRNRSHGISTQFDLLSGWSAGLEYRQDSVWQRDDNTHTDTIDEAVFFQSLYGQYMRQLETWAYTFGVRYDHHSISGGQLDPRLNLVYFLNSTWKTSLNISRGFRPPTVNDLFWPFSQETYFGTTYITAGNRNLKPEKAMSYDLGLEGKFNNSCQAKATVFYIASQDLMIWQQENVTLTTYRYAPQNVSRGKNLGLEVETSQSFSSQLRHKLVYTAMQAQGKKESDPDYLLLAFRPKHKLSYQLDYQPMETVAVNLQSQFLGACFEQDGERGLKVPSASIWSVALQKKINSAILALKVDNIFDKRYATRTDGFGNFYPLPGRTYWFSFDLYLKN
jgi:outer membrane receptor for ferrienterochelin and colicin